MRPLPRKYYNEVELRVVARANATLLATGYLAAWIWRSTAGMRSCADISAALMTDSNASPQREHAGAVTLFPTEAPFKSCYQLSDWG